MKIARALASCLLALVGWLYGSTAWAQSSKPFWRAEGQATIESEGGDSRLRGPGWMRTSRAYLDVRVEFDVRVIEPDADGALLLRGVVPRPGALPSSGYRIALASTSKHQLGELEAISSKLAGEAFHGRSALSAAWHHIAVTAIRDEIVTNVDGEKVSSTQGREHQAGYIGLHVTRGTLEFRHIAITPISACNESTTTAGRAGDAAASTAPKPDHADVRLPQVVRQQKPQYTIEAMADHVQGVVWVDAVVQTDGTVGVVCVTKPLHEDLDVEAIAAARQWRFKPGMRNGEPVPVLVTIELTFRLK